MAGIEFVATDTASRVVDVGVVLLGLALIPVVLVLCGVVLAFVQEFSFQIGLVLAAGGAVALATGYIAAMSSLSWCGGIALAIGVVAVLTSD